MMMMIIMLLEDKNDINLAEYHLFCKVNIPEILPKSKYRALHYVMEQTKRKIFICFFRA